MENKCRKERGMKHTHLDRWTCVGGKWMIPRHESSPRYRIAHGWKIWVWICIKALENLWSKKNRGASLLFFYFYFISFSFFSLSFFLSYSFFPLLFFSSHHNFFIFYFFLLLLRIFLQHNTYIAFVRDDVMTPPPCLNDARPRA
jgi:hypothetical protein